MTRLPPGSLKFVQVDVFAERPFEGNPLCVVLDGRNLDVGDMQAIAREMNLSETTFVLPATDPRAAYSCRIFTPRRELPFAGHPVLGTAFVVAREGVPGGAPLTHTEPETRLSCEVPLGRLDVSLEVSAGRIQRVVMEQPRPEFGPALQDVGPLADALGVPPDALELDGLRPQVVKTGLAHLMVPARSVEVVAELRPDLARLEAVAGGLGVGGAYVFAFGSVVYPAEVHARAFVPGHGVAEDPATGSAAGPLGAYLAAWRRLPTGRDRFLVEQGVELQRPSLLHVEVVWDAEREAVAGVRVGGRVVEVLRGEFTTFQGFVERGSGHHPGLPAGPV